MLEEKLPGKLEVKAGKSKLKRAIKYGCIGLLVGSIIAYSQFKQEMAWWIQENPKVVKYTPPLVDKVYGLLFDRKDLLRISTTTAPVEHILTAKADGINESVADKAYGDYSNNDLRDLKDSGYEWDDIAYLVDVNNISGKVVPKDYAVEFIEELKDRGINTESTDYLGCASFYGFSNDYSAKEMAGIYVSLTDVYYKDYAIFKMLFLDSMSDKFKLDFDYVFKASKELTTPSVDLGTIDAGDAVAAAQYAGYTLDDLRNLRGAGFNQKAIFNLSGINSQPNGLSVPVEFALRNRNMESGELYIFYEKELKK